MGARGPCVDRGARASSLVSLISSPCAPRTPGQRLEIPTGPLEASRLVGPTLRR